MFNVKKFVLVEGLDAAGRVVKAETDGLVGVFKAILLAREVGITGDFVMVYHITKDGVPTKGYPQRWTVGEDNVAERVW